MRGLRELPVGADIALEVARALEEFAELFRQRACRPSGAVCRRRMAPSHDPLDGVAVEGLVPSGVPQRLHHPGNADLFGQVEDAAHVVARRAALRFPQTLLELDGDAAQLGEPFTEHEAAAARSVELRFMLRQDVALVLGVPEAMLGHHIVLAVLADYHLELAHEHAHPDGGLGESGRDGVAVRLPGDAVVVAHLPRLHDGGVEPVGGQGQQQRSLLVEARAGLLVGGPVLALVLLVAPSLGLGVEVVEVVKDAAGEEVAFDGLEGLLDLAFPLAVPRRQRDRRVAVVDDERLEERVKEHALLEALQDDLLHPVVEDFVRGAAGLLEGHHVAVGDAVDVGMKQEVDELPPAEAEDHRETDDLGRCRAQLNRIGRKVDLSLLAWVGLEALMKAAPGRGAKAADVHLEDRVAVRVPDRPNLLEDAHGGELVFEDELLDQRPERVEHRRFLLLRFGVRCQDAPDGSFVAAHLLGDGAAALTLGPQGEDELVAPAAPLTLLPPSLPLEPSALASRQAVCSAWVNIGARSARSVGDGGSSRRARDDSAET